MAALIGPATVLRRLIFILVAAGVVAQDRAAPVPVWPDDGRIPPQYSDRYVFLTRDKHTIVVLAPERPETGIAGPKKNRQSSAVEQYPALRFRFSGTRVLRRAQVSLHD